MSGPKGKLDSRLDQLEREILALKRQLGGQPSRYGHGAAPSQVRLARTAPDSGAYPLTGNTFPIIFLDGDFDEDPGTNTLTTTDRQSEPAEKYAHDVGNVYRPEGEKVWVVRQNGLYWIVSGLTGLWGVLEDELLSDGTPADAALLDSTGTISVKGDRMLLTGMKLVTGDTVFAVPASGGWQVLASRECPVAE